MIYTYALCVQYMYMCNFVYNFYAKWHLITSRFQYVVMLYKISNLQVSTSPFVRITYHIFEEGNIMLWHWIYDILDTGNCALSYTTLYQ